MQIELVDKNSLGHTNQIGNVLQPTFASLPTESSGNAFLWPHGSDSFRTNPRCNPAVPGVVNRLENATVSDSFISSLEDSVHQQYFTRSVPNETTSQIVQRNAFAPRGCSSHYQPQSAIIVMPNASQAAVPPDIGPISNMDDFIELDLSYRPFSFASDGDTTEQELNAPRQLPLQPARPEPSTIPSQARTGRISYSHHLSVDQFYGSFRTTGNHPSSSRPVGFSPHLVDDFGSNCPLQATSCSREPIRRARSSSPSPSSQSRDTIPPETSDSASVGLGHIPSDSPCSFYSPLQSSISSSTSSSSSFVHRPSVETPLSADRVNTNTTSAVTVISPVLSLEVPDSLPFHYRHTPTPSADVSMENLSQTQSIMLLPTNELALGGSLTCTVVNILKGLRLLHRCGLEDLCVSLYGLRSIESNAYATPSATPEEPTASRSNLAYSMTDHALFPYLDSFVIRSSSFTSAALISPRRSTVPRDYSQNGDLCTQIPRGTRTTAQAVIQNNCLVNYILTCSRTGSSLLCPSISDLSHPGTELAASRTLSHHLSGIDWRRGCASNLVNLLTSNSACAVKSRTPVSRLIAGRFLMGLHAWRSVWPYSIKGVVDNKPADPHGQSLSGELISWISTWIRQGAVIVLAQLVSPVITSQSESNVAPTELLWCHRVVYGVSQKDEIYLSNPIELVPVDDVLHELSRQTTLRLEKSILDELWSEHLSCTRISPPRQTWPTSRSMSTGTGDSARSEATNNRGRSSERVIDIRNNGADEVDDEEEGSSDSDMVEVDALGNRVQLVIDKAISRTDSHPHRTCVGDFSPLACQLDPRWNELNVLGQVLQTLRGLGSVNSNPGSQITSSTAGNFSLERSSLSSSIVIPCAQSPGFSLFVPKTSWELVHTLYAPPPFTRPDN